MSYYPNTGFQQPPSVAFDAGGDFVCSDQAIAGGRGESEGDRSGIGKIDNASGKGAGKRAGEASGTGPVLER